MIEDNSTVGVVVYHADAGFEHTTIQNNGSAGLWLYDSPARDFHENAITGNDTNTSLYPGRDGVEVVGGSDVYLFKYEASGYNNGYNRVANNPGDQVLNDYSSHLEMGVPYAPLYGDNGIFGGNGYRVNNENSSFTLPAFVNWWGTTSPSAGLFYGDVIYTDYLSSDPTGNAGAGSGQYPGQMAPVGSEPVLVQSTASPGPSDVKMGASTSTISSTVQTDERETRRGVMHALWGKIAQSINAPGLMKKMEKLYQLQLMSYGDSSFATERAQDRSIWGSMIQQYLSGNQSGNPGGVRLSASQVETLMLMDEHEAYRFGHYAEARKKVTQYDPYITSTRGKIIHMTDQMNLLDQQGSYKEELALLDKVKQAEVSLGVSKEMVDARYQIAADEMERALGQADVKSGSVAPGETSGNENTATSVKPAVTALKTNYPNPFNPTTTISYQLAKSSHVRLTVWNILGRRVATLVNANQQKGVHQAIFNASQLASGIYFYRLQAGDKVMVKKMLLMK